MVAEATRAPYSVASVQYPNELLAEDEENEPALLLLKRDSVIRERFEAKPEFGARV